MIFLANILIVGVAGLHIWFLILEMFLWQKPIGLKTFRQSKEVAKLTSVLAANQGLYNGFLAAGLLISFAFQDYEMRYFFQVFFLSCVIVAGFFGAYTVSRRIFFIQALPALVALAMIVGLHFST